MKDVVAVAVVFLFLASLGVVLSGCERGPTEEDMAGCASPRNPTWADVAKCNAQSERPRHEETVK